MTVDHSGFLGHGDVFTGPVTEDIPGPRGVRLVCGRVARGPADNSPVTLPAP